MQFECAHCGKTADKPSGHVNRSRKRGMALYCDQICSGLGRRTGKTKAEKVEEKRQYDAEYRRKNRDALKAKKSEYFQRTYDPVKAAEERKTRMPRHVEYCRRPEYRAWKRDYDRQYRAEKEYGPLADCFLLVMDIRKVCLEQMTDYEIRQSKGTLNKRQQRRRDYERLVSNQPQIGSVGDIERGQGWQNGGLASGLRRLPSAGNSSHHEYPAPRGPAGEASGRRGRDFVR